MCFEPDLVLRRITHFQTYADDLREKNERVHTFISESGYCYVI